MVTSVLEMVTEMGRRPDAFGAVYVTFTHREGPEPTPPSRNGRVTADFQRSIHLLGFRVSIGSLTDDDMIAC